MPKHSNSPVRPQQPRSHYQIIRETPGVALFNEVSTRVNRLNNKIYQDHKKVLATLLAAVFAPPAGTYIMCDEPFSDARYYLGLWYVLFLMIIMTSSCFGKHMVGTGDQLKSDLKDLNTFLEKLAARGIGNISDYEKQDLASKMTRVTRDCLENDEYLETIDPYSRPMFF